MYQGLAANRVLLGFHLSLIVCWNGVVPYGGLCTS